MKRSSLAPAAERPGDSEAMREAIRFLEERGLPATRPTQFQLKFFDLNFYPDKGTITRDGQSVPLRKGLEAFKALVEDKVENIDIVDHRKEIWLDRRG